MEALKSVPADSMIVQKDSLRLAQEGGYKAGQALVADKIAKACDPQQPPEAQLVHVQQIVSETLAQYGDFVEA